MQAVYAKIITNIKLDLHFDCLWYRTKLEWSQLQTRPKHLNIKYSHLGLLAILLSTVNSMLTLSSTITIYCKPKFTPNFPIWRSLYMEERPNRSLLGNVGGFWSDTSMNLGSSLSYTGDTEYWHHCYLYIKIFRCEALQPL